MSHVVLNRSFLNDWFAKLSKYSRFKYKKHGSICHFLHRLLYDASNFGLLCLGTLNLFAELLTYANYC